MTDVKGLEKENFQQYYEASNKAIVGSVIVPVLHINHLIESKKASARPKDLLDIVELEKIRKA